MLRNRRRSEEKPINGLGSIDAPEHGMVRGWALNPDEPEVRSLVQITIDGNPFLTVIANEYRSDLLVAKLGDGYHAFSAVLPSGLLDGAEHKLAATIAGTEIALQHSPRVCVFPARLRLHQRTPGRAEPFQTRCSTAFPSLLRPETMVRAWNAICALVRCRLGIFRWSSSWWIGDPRTILRLVSLR